MSLLTAPWPSATALPGEPAPRELTLAEAQSQLVGYRRALVSHLRRKGFSPEEADDLTQETLLRAYSHLTAFRGYSLSAWLHRIAANVAIDHVRRRRLETVSLDDVAPAEEQEPSWLEAIDRERQQGLLLGAIRRLAPCHQRILIMRYYEDRSLEEIAALVQCTRPAAKLRVFRAVSALRRYWKNHPLETH